MTTAVGNEAEEDADVTPRQERGVARRRRSTERRGSGADEAFDRLEAAKKAAAELAAQDDNAWTSGDTSSGSDVAALEQASASEVERTAAPMDAFVEKMSSGVVPTLEDCERHITTVTMQWLLAVGYALEAIREHELFKDKGYTSFTAYIKAEHPWHPSYVSRVIADIPVVEALEC
jgi:hypothetical protein